MNQIPCIGRRCLGRQGGRMTFLEQQRYIGKEKYKISKEGNNQETLTTNIQTGDEETKNILINLAPQYRFSKEALEIFDQTQFHSKIHILVAINAKSEQ